MIGEMSNIVMILSFFAYSKALLILYTTTHTHTRAAIHAIIFTLVSAKICNYKTFKETQSLNSAPNPSWPKVTVIFALGLGGSLISEVGTWTFHQIIIPAASYNN